MKTLVKIGTTLAMGAAMALSSIAPASASDVVMKNNPADYRIGYCSGNVYMGYFYTERPDIYSATYTDEYKGSDGVWRPGGRSYTLSDPESASKLMISNLIGAWVRVRADHYVYTVQGSACSQ